MDVADEVDDPFQCLLLLGDPNFFLKSTAGVVRDGRDDTPLFWTVSLVVDIAALGWVVKSINIMVDGAELAAFLVSIAVRPGSDVGEIRRGCIVQQMFGELGCLLAHKVLGDVCDCSVAEGSPGVDMSGKNSQKR
jgi:hypothetical protein